ncbi:uncharacterized protein LAJ45_09266 [Morchella importuna]|uniref:uncharacterized protein n=1 Tax=Morchella importuna TaxID=1174673 RepID=UPI001E8E5F1B|nr:uncharacterized protein LAJ45_09266 [Morchella importuna]KAH8146584.1 hypothetical protein LAJ45_09266 [Morchella importuna]
MPKPDGNEGGTMGERGKKRHPGEHEKVATIRDGQSAQLLCPHKFLISGWMDSFSNETDRTATIASLSIEQGSYLPETSVTLARGKVSFSITLALYQK